MVHNLKIWPEYLRAIKEGRKTFEVRSTEDRFFEEGDLLILREWLPDEGRFTGDKIRAEILLVHTGLGLQAGFAALSIRPLGEVDADKEQLAHDAEEAFAAERERLVEALRAARAVISALGAWTPGNPVTGPQLDLIQLAAGRQYAPQARRPLQRGQRGSSAPGDSRREAPTAPRPRGGLHQRRPRAPADRHVRR